MEKGKQRRAVLVGCNYLNTKNELHGCINDVVAMKEVLIKRFRFESSGIELLTDAPRPGSNLAMHQWTWNQDSIYETWTPI
ncbi:hypothetical protein EZV62_005352 [Acer yangbiense]|uniref:Peptidase C14 caspase domain-containing protein n=1 Tax=Acer yangbiense TaxID=1000413 RepID=A0A5C7ILY6_9ROSI|nr:hypothetical protein EZV62_005352 [Acer yangbiense]